KVKSQPNGYPARRRAIQKLKNQFYFLRNNVRSGRAAFRPLWGVVLTFFLLLQGCELNRDHHIGQSSGIINTGRIAEYKPGALLFYSESAAATAGFSREYLTHGYQDDLYLRNQFSKAVGGANIASSRQDD